MKTREQVLNEALNVIKPLHNAGVGITMGVGKTYLGLRHMEYYYNEFARYLIVAPKKAILKSWKEEAIKHNLGYLIPHMTFTTYLSLIKQDLDYDVVYLDECHSLKLSHEPWLCAFTGVVIGLTGTPPKYNKSEKGKIINNHCPIVYRYITDSAVEDEILNDYRIVVHMMSLSKFKNLPMSKNNKTWYTSEQASYDYWTNRIDASVTQKEINIMRIMRMKAMMEFPSKEAKAKSLLALSKDKTIVFANTMEQADRIHPISYHSSNPKSEKNLEDFKNGVIDKLSCVLQLSEGVNIPELKTGIILHAYGNERKASQRIGRLMRLNPTEKSTVHILCYMGTVDEDWVREALSDFDKSKITWIPSK